MLPSFYKTHTGNNDIMIADEGYVTEAINKIFNQFPNYDYYHITNDDVTYHTPNWDTKLIQVLEDYGPGIAYGNDLFQGQNLCTFPMISGDIVRKLGWLQLPTLNKYAGDVVWKMIGEHCKCLYYVPEVIIEHHWEGASEELNKKDMAKFAEWLPWSFRDIKRVMEVVNVKH